MLHILVVLSVALMIACLFLLILGLPGIWGMLLILGAWAVLLKSSFLTWQFFVVWVGLAVCAEIVEFVAGYFGVKKFGGTTKGSIGGIVGAFAGAILCTPLFFGLGALLGALGGGFLGCFIVERGRGMLVKPALRAACGATLGRFGGFLVKLAVGLSLLFAAVPLLWQSVQKKAPAVMAFFM